MSISRLFVCFIALLLAFGGAAAQEPTLPAATPTPSPTATPIPAPTPPPDPLAAYANLYRVGNGAFVSVAKLSLAQAAPLLLLTDFRTGQIRELAAGATAPDNFTAGPGVSTPEPVKLTANFERNPEGRVKRLTWQQEGFGITTGEPAGGRREEVSFASGAALLSGTLLFPPGRGRFPAIAMLHEAGPQNRYAFGPFPDFFLSKGYAVLIYDKRGIASSGGTHNADMWETAADGRAAVQFLRQRGDINGRKIGLAGFGQGGMLAAQVAANNRDVAFLVNFSGAFVPVAEQELYRVEAAMRADAQPEADINSALALLRAGFDAARTGQGWERYTQLKAASEGAAWRPYVLPFASLSEAQTLWKQQYGYDPALSLRQVSCPVLALFGALDRYTPTQISAERMQVALRTRRNDNFTFYVFPQANHQLLAAVNGTPQEIPRLQRFAPGLFEALSFWLRQR